MRAALMARCASGRGIGATHRPTRLKPLCAAAPNKTLTGRAKSVVEVQWLHSKLKNASTKILDASWYMPAAERKPIEEHKHSRIPGALFFDINAISDSTIDLPHMLPTEVGFAAAADALGIKVDDHVVVYDGMGLFSAARAWWMFKVFGHQKVSVLNGGLPAWKASGYDLEQATEMTDEEVQIATIACRNAVKGKTQYPAKLDASQVRNLDAVMKLLESKGEQIVDARSEGRFHGTAPEPRKGLRSGHIPGASSIPYSTTLTPEGLLKSKEELIQIFQNAGVDMGKDVVCSCGTGVTACVLALALDYIGFDKNVAVYDGSWSEWGLRNDTPIET